jgi:cell division protein FtsB
MGVAVVMLLSLAGACLGANPQYLEQENIQLRRRIERLENAIEELKTTVAIQAKPAVAADAAVAASSPMDSSNRDVEDLRQENAQLRQRVENLEGALAELNREKTTTRNPPVEKAPAVPPNAAEKKPAPAPAGAAGKKNVVSSLDLEFYGYVKADASYDSSRTTPGNFVVYVDSEATRKNDDEFNLTANQTRLGLNISGPSSDTLKTSGRVEFDFYGNYASENKAKIQMRHAYLVLDWPKARFSILAGQTSDIISPLVPNTLNYTVLWDAGNIGYRRPQIRLTQVVPMGEKASLKLEGGCSRTIGRTDLTNSESGEDAGFPTLQGRVSMTFPFFGPKPTTVGVSGHRGTEEYDLNPTGQNVDFDSWSVNLDVTQPVCPWLTIKGELFAGENLDQYFGGIGQGVNTTALKEISAEGGWVAASLGPWSQWSFNVGAGIDSVDRNDVTAGGRTQNTSIFGNVLYSLNKHAQVGVEVSQWNTHYRGPGDADDMRAQASFIYKF